MPDEQGMARAERALAERGFAKVGEQGYQVAYDGIPVDTGKLRDSLWAAVWQDGSEVWSRGTVPPDPPITRRGIETLIGVGTDYARFVHDGTVDTPQHPFLSEALAVLRTGLADLVAGGFAQ